MIKIFVYEEVFDAEVRVIRKALAFAAVVVSLLAAAFLPSLFVSANSTPAMIGWLVILLLVVAILAACLAMIVYYTAHLRKLNTPVIGAIFDSMIDHEWHSVGGLSNDLGIMPDDTRIFLKCLLRAGYIESNEVGGNRYRMVAERTAELARRTYRQTGVR